MTNSYNLVGKEFGKLTVLERSGTSKHGGIMWLCLCECGNKKVVRSDRLRSSEVKCCGCSSKMHRLRRTPEYNAWAHMMQRCNNPNNKAYEHYGGRGIKVCTRWKTFKNFYNDMGKRPSDKHTLDRIDVNGNYEPDNCKWATRQEQAINRRVYSFNVSGHTGVTFDKGANKWRSRITVNKKLINLGHYENKEDAIKARKDAENKYWN